MLRLSMVSGPANLIAVQHFCTAMPKRVPAPATVVTILSRLLASSLVPRNTSPKTINRYYRSNK